MKPLNKIIFLLWLILLLSAPAVAGQEIGGVSEVLGGVDILKGGKLPAEPAKAGDKVSQGDVIRTKSGGKAQIRFKDDSVITIAPDSRVALNEFVYEPEKNQRDASIKVFNGLVHTVVNKLLIKDKPDFTVETQTAIIGIRGTDFYTLAAPAVTDIYNNSGTTEVRNLLSTITGTVKLKGRFRTQVAKNLPPSPPVPITEDDIKLLQEQLNPKPLDKLRGSFLGREDYLDRIGDSSQELHRSKYFLEPHLGQKSFIENLQSPLYVPPQPIKPSMPNYPSTPPIPPSPWPLPPKK